MIKKLKLRTILMVSLALLLASTVSTISLISYRAFSDAIVDQMADSRIDVLQQVSTRMSEVQRVMLTLSNLCFQTPYLTEYLQEEEAGYAAGQELARLDTLGRVIGESSGTSPWFEIAMEGGYAYSSHPHRQPVSYREHAAQLWFQDLDPTGGEVAWNGQFISPEGDFVISAARMIVDPKTGEPAGLCLVRVEESALSSTYMPTMPQASGNSIYMVDHKGRVVSHSDKYMLGFNYYNMDNFHRIFQSQEYAVIEKSGVDHLFSYYQNPDTGWLVVEEIPLAAILAPVHRLQVDIWRVSLVVLILSGCLAAVIASRTTRPLNRLCRQFEQVGTGASVKFDVTGWHEITTICEECNGMVERIDNLLAAVKAREGEKRRAEIAMLQLQVHPHFLYNTLFSIRCLVEMRDYGRAIPMITAFIRLLQGMLETHREWIPLGDELDLLEQYVYIQKYRFGDKFSFAVDCPRELRDCRVLRLLLQPLVENAILHGMRDREGQGIIRLEIRRREGDLVLRLMDNGVGMDPDFARNLPLRQSGGGHIGIGNVAERLRLHFGPGYGLAIDSGPCSGTSITIRIPLRGEEEEGASW